MGRRGVRLPPHIHAFVDRHGKARFYVRRPGFARVALPGLPWSPEFMGAYQAAMAGEAVRRDIGANRTKPGSVNALAVAYYNSTEFRSLAPITQSTYRGVVEAFRADHGEKRVALLQREHIGKLMAKKVATPSAANNWLRMLRMLMKFAIDQGMRQDDPTAGVKTVKIRSVGFHTWTEEQIAAFEAHHPIGTRPRLALALLLYTAQRRADVVRIGKQHIRAGALHVRQQKTGVVLEIPVHPELQAIIAATPSDHLTFLTTDYGKPRTAAGFGNWFRERCNEAGLPAECASHGLRKAACRRLAEAGCSANQIAAISGHTTLREVERYTKAASQARMAREAMRTVHSAFPAGRGTAVGKPE